MLEVDLQFGLIRGRGPYILELPDFEVDLGLTRAIELDLDGAMALQDAPGESFSFDQTNPDNLWLAVKAPVFDIRDPDAGWGVGFGFQIGPKLPVAPQAEGVGGEGLALIGLTVGPTQVVFNMGGLIDPGAGAAGRPQAVEGGVDFAHALDSQGRWSATAEVGGVHFFTSDPDQLSMTAGLAFDPTPNFEVSLVGLVGVLNGSDRYGALLGISPKLRLWR